MAIDNEMLKQIVIFERYANTRDDSEIKNISLLELRVFDGKLGPIDLNSSYRTALRHRIRALEQSEQWKHESHVRALNYVIGLLSGIIITVIAALFLRYLS